MHMSQLARTAIPPNFFGALLATVSHAHTLEALTRPLLELLQSVTGLESTYLARLDEPQGVVCVQ
jgi:diguanylate cyclase